MYNVQIIIESLNWTSRLGHIQILLSTPVQWLHSCNHYLQDLLNPSTEGVCIFVFLCTYM